MTAIIFTAENRGRVRDHRSPDFTSRIVKYAVRIYIEDNMHASGETVRPLEYLAGVAVMVGGFSVSDCLPSPLKFTRSQVILRGR